MSDLIEQLQQATRTLIEVAAALEAVRDEREELRKTLAEALERLERVVAERDELLAKLGITKAEFIKEDIPWWEAVEGRRLLDRWVADGVMHELRVIGAERLAEGRMILTTTVRAPGLPSRAGGPIPIVNGCVEVIEE